MLFSSFKSVVPYWNLFRGSKAAHDIFGYYRVHDILITFIPTTMVPIVLFYMPTNSKLIALPAGIKIVSVTPSGASAWVQTVRIDTKQKDGSLKSYFKKVRMIKQCRGLYCATSKNCSSPSRNQGRWESA